MPDYKRYLDQSVFANSWIQALDPSLEAGIGKCIDSYSKNPGKEISTEDMALCFASFLKHDEIVLLRHMKGKIIDNANTKKLLEAVSALQITTTS